MSRKRLATSDLTLSSINSSMKKTTPGCSFASKASQEAFPVRSDFHRKRPGSHRRGLRLEPSRLFTTTSICRPLPRKARTCDTSSQDNRPVPHPIAGTWCSSSAKLPRRLLTLQAWIAYPKSSGSSERTSTYIPEGLHQHVADHQGPSFAAQRIAVADTERPESSRLQVLAESSADSAWWTT